MDINLDDFTEEELIDLNNRIVARLDLLHQIKQHRAMLEFRVGERVCYRARSGILVCGVLTKFNKVTVTVITDEGEQRNVPPSFLMKVEPPKPASSGDGKIIPLRRK